MRARQLTPLLCLVLVVGLASKAGAQADPLHFTFNSGQTIQPVFEGWARNADGTFELHFGYLNRNYVEAQHVPVGAANRMSPGAADQGQPTYFYPRDNSRVFSVTVPADWGIDQRLVWQVTIRDETYRAEGWLQPEWEIFAAPFSAFFASSAGAAENQAPALSAIEVPSVIRVGEGVTLSARVSDDGLPERRERGRGQEQPPTFQPEAGPTLPVNVPQLQPSARKRPTRVEVENVHVTWTQLRGPTGVTVTSQEAPGEGVAAVTATFASAGDYLFRVEASDGPETVTRELAVTVR